MAKCTMEPLLKRAQLGRYAVGAFNVHSLEGAQAIVAAAEEELSPVILQINQATIDYAGLEPIVAMVQAVADKAYVPVAINLDHCTHFPTAVQCMAEGFTAVMFDGSNMSLEQNINAVRQVVKVAQALGVDVEGEVGRIEGVEDDLTGSSSQYTDVDSAERFVKETGVCCLAVAIGTAHGVYRSEPRLDMQRLEQIAKNVKVPLVLHGGSGLPDEAVRETIGRGICKVNISTELKKAFISSLDISSDDPREALGAAREAMKRIVRHKIRVFGSSAKAS